MKIVYMGTPDFAVGPLEALIRSENEITCVVTQPDRAKGRSGKLVPSPVKECAVANGIDVITPERLKNPEEAKLLEAYPADLFVVAAFGQILPKEVLNMPKYGCINIHASLLPKYRGAAPIQQCIIDGEKKTGVTIMQMNEGLDTGDILLQKEIEIADDETGGSLFDRLAALGSEMVIEAVKLIEEGKTDPVKQDDSRATYAGMLKKETGRIDWEKSAEEIERLIRGCDPWPGTFTSFGGKQLKIYKAKAAPGNHIEQRQFGCITYVTDDCIGVMTGKGILEITELQLEGKKRMPVADFVRGRKIEPGEKLVD